MKKPPIPVYLQLVSTPPDYRYRFPGQRQNSPILTPGQDRNRISFLPLDVIWKEFAPLTDSFSHRVKLVISADGEPMLHPQFPQVMSALREMNFSYSLQTTGLYLSENGNAEACRFPESVKLVLNGFGKAYDLEFGHVGSFDKLMEGYYKLVSVLMGVPKKERSTLAISLAGKKLGFKETELYSSMAQSVFIVNSGRKPGKLPRGDSVIVLADGMLKHDGRRVHMRHAPLLHAVREFATSHE